MAQSLIVPYHVKISLPFIWMCVQLNTAHVLIVKGENPTIPQEGCIMNYERTEQEEVRAGFPAAK
jgi:hypothetical protein